MAELGHLVPVDRAVEADPEPAAVSGNGGRKTRSGAEATSSSWAPTGAAHPQVREVVVVVAAVPQHHELLADEEGRRSVAVLLGHLGECRADGADPVLGGAHGSSLPHRRAASGRRRRGFRGSLRSHLNHRRR